MIENYYHIEMELTGVTPEKLATHMMEHFKGILYPILGMERQYMVSDHLRRDWFLLRSGEHTLLLSPALDPDSDLLQAETLPAILKKAGAFMDDGCGLRIRAQGLTQKAVDEMFLTLKEELSQ